MSQKFVEVEFAQTSKGSKVHVLGGTFKRNWEHAEIFYKGLVGRTYCGKDVMIIRGGGVVGAFKDDMLCARCYDLFPGEKDLLFEHHSREEDLQWP